MPHEHEPADNPKGTLASRAPAARVTVFAVFLLGLVALGVSIAVTSGELEPDPACGLCHGGAAIVDAHVSTPCYACHAGPGAVRRASRLIVDAAQAMRGIPLGPSEAMVDRRACSTCHVEVMTTVVLADGIRIQHRTCVTREAECTDCHSDTAHGRISADRARSMDRCSGCHDGKAAPKDCDTCHFGEPSRRDALNAWAVTHGRNRHETHGMGDLRTCVICHEPADCGKCHIPVPHDATWPRVHGSEAIAQGEEACLTCHVRELCDGCHGIAMPHPVSWLPEHPSAVPGDDVEKRCMECHSLADCRDCHTRHVHPGLRTGDPLNELRTP